jgi:RNA polymerase sigma-70 factor (ECF subfamily)
VEAQDSYNEQQILRSLADGSEQAFALLYEHHKTHIYRTALRFLKSRPLAEEIVQETFLKVWQKREDMHQVRNLRAYLFVTARNFILQQIEKVARDSMASQEFAHGLTPDNNIEKFISEKQFEQAVNIAVDKLPSQQKLVFKMAREENLSHEAIARRLNISRLTVKKHMQMALRTLRLQLQDILHTIILASVILFG